MTRFFWWLRKELREHRAFLLLLVLVIPLGSWLMVHVTRGQPLVDIDGPLPAAWAAHTPVRPLVHTWRRELWEGMLLVGLGLAVAGLAGGLFGAERRRGTAALMARTPGAWRTAFLAKLTFLALALTAVLLMHAAVLGRLAFAYDMTRDAQAGQPVVDTALLLPETLSPYVFVAVGVLALWVVLASATLPVPAVPVLVGGAACVGLAVPAILWAEEHRFFFRVWLGGAGIPLAFWGLVGLALVAWVWLRWVRIGRSVASIAVRTLVVSLAIGGAATGITWAAVSKYRTFGPEVADLRLDAPVVGVGNRFAYVHAYRGNPDDTGEGPPRWPPIFGTRLQPWRIDLETGAWSAEGDPGEAWEAPQPSLHPLALDGVATLLFLPRLGRSDGTGAWFDARTGQRLTGGDRNHLPPDGAERLRAGLRERSHTVDAAGRRAWYFEGRLEREGAEPVAVENGGDPLDYLLEVPGGWALYARQDPAHLTGDPPSFISSLDANDGRRRYLPPNVNLMGWIDTKHVLQLRARYIRSTPPLPLSAFEVLDLDTLARHPLVEDASSAIEVFPVARVGDTGLLVSHGRPGALHLGLSSMDGSAITDLSWEASPIEGVESVRVLSGRRLIGIWGSLDDPIVLCLQRSASWPVKPGDPRANSPGSDLRVGEAWALYVPETKSLRVLRPWAPLERDYPIRIRALPDGSMLALEAQRRIVRLGPAAGQRTVLFPR